MSSAPQELAVKTKIYKLVLNDKHYIYLKASYFGPPHNPDSDNVEYGNSASKSRGVKSIQKTDIVSRWRHLSLDWLVNRLSHITADVFF